VGERFVKNVPICIELTDSSGCDPLTPEDVAEVIVFAAGRRENVVVADTLMFPSHQVSGVTSIPDKNY
jgi:hypothetical protein